MFELNLDAPGPWSNVGLATYYYSSSSSESLCLPDLDVAASAYSAKHHFAFSTPLLRLYMILSWCVVLIYKLQIFALQM